MAITSGLKISQLPQSFDFQATDFLAVSRGGDTKRVSGQAVLQKVFETILNNKFVTDLPGVDGIKTVFEISHNLNSKDLIIQVYEKNPPFELVQPTIKLKPLTPVDPDPNIIIVTFSTPPTIVKQYRVVVMKLPPVN
jgi:hypothetical protein